MTSYFVAKATTKPKGAPMTSAVLVRTLRDILSAFRPALLSLPADADVHQAQRLVATLDAALERIEDKS